MKRIVLGLMMGVCFVGAAKAEDTNGFRVNFRRVGLDLTSTEVKNADKYQDSSVSALSADSETVIKGVFDGVLEYEQEHYQWNNSLFMEYGKKDTKPQGKPHVKDKSADQILLTTDYAWKMWKYEGADVGPFGNLGYETQFTDNEDAPRNKILRAKTGLKLWNGSVVKELYAALVAEHDMTFEDDVDKLAAEIGWRIEYPFADNVKFKLDGYYRDYFSWSEYAGEDLKYDLSVTGRMDVKINGHFSLSPFVQYRLAESRQAGVAGSNFMIGLGMSYAQLFNIW